MSILPNNVYNNTYSDEDDVFCSKHEMIGEGPVYEKVKTIFSKDVIVIYNNPYNMSCHT